MTASSHQPEMNEIKKVISQRFVAEVGDDAFEAEEWFKKHDGRWILHREDGPALIERGLRTRRALLEEWFIDGKLHREDGPAVIVRDAKSGKITLKEWWVKGKWRRPAEAS